MQICRVKFQTLTSFNSHLFFHCVSEAEYRAVHGDPGVRYQQHACLHCGMLVQQDPLQLAAHLAEVHGTSLTAYTEQWELQQEGEAGAGEVGHTTVLMLHSTALSRLDLAGARQARARPAWRTRPASLGRAWTAAGTASRPGSSSGSGGTRRKMEGMRMKMRMKTSFLPSGLQM